MCPLCRVEDERAGPTALGILVPPGRQTFLILRPRALSFDLILLRRAEGKAFREMGYEEAAAAARGVFRTLEERADSSRAEAVDLPSGEGCWVRVSVGPFAFLACPRVPGQPYQPLVCTSAADARVVVSAIEALLCPADGIEQEVYLNTRNFSR
jgi:hypothetical protein